MKVLLAKIGLDGHDRGIKVIMDALRKEGIDVLYPGLHRTAEEIIGAAVKEHVDAIGISSLTGAHNVIFTRVFELMRERGLEIPVFAGGTIPDEDIPSLKKMGVREVFLPGTELDDVVKFVKKLGEPVH